MALPHHNAYQTNEFKCGGGVGWGGGGVSRTPYTSRLTVDFRTYRLHIFHLFVCRKN